MRIQLLADSNEPFCTPLNDLIRRVEQLYLSRLRMPRLECVDFCEELGVKGQ